MLVHCPFRPYERCRMAVARNETGKVLTGAQKAKRWRLKHPDLKQKSSRGQTLRKHGWDQERFEQSFQDQNGLCAICSVKMTLERKISKTRACTDHKHSVPPKPRALLCSACNAGLGFFCDSVHLLENATKYLRKWK